MNPRTFIVLGPESSGTRLTTRILIAGGCWGDAGHRQRMDSLAPTVVWTFPVVWRRSVPHDVDLPDLSQMIERVKPSPVEVIVTVRDPSPTAVSQLGKRVYASAVEQSLATISSAYEHIFREIRRNEVMFTLSVYESLLLSPEAAQRALWSRLGLPGGKPVEITNQNEKHWRAA